MTAYVLRGSASALPLPDSSVDLVLTSPPYWRLRNYEDGGGSLVGQLGAEDTPQEYVSALLDCTLEWLRVLKPGGSLWVNLGDKYAERGGPPRGAGVDGSGVSRRPARPRRPGMSGTGIRPKSLIGLPWRYALACVDDLELILRAEIIWAKPNGLPESVTDRARRSHEHLFHLTREPRYYADLDAVREPQVRRWASSRNGGNSYAKRVKSGAEDSNLRTSEPNPAGAIPGSVWTIATAGLTAPADLEVEHFAAWPPELVRRIVLGWSPPGGVVLDPFGGTGTTAMVADVLGRTGLSVDLSHDYSRLARWRTTDPRERAAAAGNPRPKPECELQDDLFAPSADPNELPGQSTVFDFTDVAV